MREKYLCDKNLFKLTAQGIYCGVLVPTSVMRKVMKVENQAMNEIRKILHDSLEELYPAEWTLANNKNTSGEILKQITIDYTTNNRDEVNRRVSLFKPRQPERCDVYIVPNREIAEKIAKEILQEHLREVKRKEEGN